MMGRNMHFGGKGSGKSTFLKKLLYHKQPKYLAKHSVIAIVDLLDTAHEKDQIRRNSWNTLVEILDSEQLLKGDRNRLLYLFKDKYELAKKQVLFGLDEGTEAFNIKLNDLVQAWLQDTEYCAERIGTYWKSRHKGLIVVIDNTDQFPEELQDYCFAISREIASKLDCLVIISMREERYYSSKIHGILDAFSFSSFHISSPYPELVFQRRIEFVKKILRRKELYEPIIGEANSDQIKGYKRLFNIFSKTFEDDNSPLNNFLAACAHGDIRSALDLFKGFTLSGYTNVVEMTSRSHWNISVHQVVKPALIPDRFFYDENKSAIPNVYQIRSKQNGSHFTALRILRLLDRGQDQSNPAYISITEVIDYFDINFNMIEDCEQNLNILLKGGFIEANNRLDKYSEDVDSIRITNYGHYMLHELAFYFAYIDLICVDCAFYSEEIANFIVKSSNYDRRIYRKRQPENRINNRLERTEKFLNYLEGEENSEIERYNLTDDYIMLSKITIEKFRAEKPRVIVSAKRAQRRVDGG